MENLPDNPHIYQINLMTWLHELGNREQQNRTLATIPDREWRYLKDKGMDIVWLMGIWKRSPDSRKKAQGEPFLVDESRTILPDFVPEDIVGSPYAVHGYSCDPILGSMEDLRLLKKKNGRNRSFPCP